MAQPVGWVLCLSKSCLKTLARYIGGGRRHWDGSGGSNGALEHFEEVCKSTRRCEFCTGEGEGELLPTGGEAGNDHPGRLVLLRLTLDVPSSRQVFCWCAQALYQLASAFRDLYCRHGPDEGSLSRLNTSWLHVWCSADACFRLNGRFNAVKARPGLGTRSLWAHFRQ